MHTSKTLTRSLSQNKVISTKLIMGVMVAAVSVLVGTSNIANAAPGHGHGPHNNHGAAVSAVARANHGFGYGGNVGVSVGDIMGDNNVVVIVINYFIGH